MINKFSILNGEKYFSSGIFQNYLVFTPAKEYIKYFSGTTRINSWNSNGMSEENIENLTKSQSNFAPILILGEGPTQGLDDTTLTAEAKLRKRFVFSLHYNGSNSFSFVSGTKIINSKQKTLK